jgi:hypothetical protein
MDCLNIHRNHDDWFWLANNNIFVSTLLEYTTYFLQPLDNVLFANFKNKIVDLTSKYLDQIGTGKMGATWLSMSALYDAIEASFTERVIKSAFEHTGIMPFQKKKILQIANETIPHHQTFEDKTDEKMNELFRQYIDVTSPSKKVMVQKMKVNKKKIYNVDEASEAMERFQKEKEEEELTKILLEEDRRIQKEDKKKKWIEHQKQKEQEKEARLQKKILDEKKKSERIFELNERKERKRCQVKGCEGVRHQSNLKSQCEWCDFSVCLKHQDTGDLEEHKRRCSRTNKIVFKIKIPNSNVITNH